MPTLPQLAFMPIRLLDEPERQKWVARRDYLFSQCDADEQACLVKLAEWFNARRPGVMKLFSKSYLADANYRYAPAISPKPSALACGLAEIHARLCELGNWGEQRFQRSFLQRLQKLRDDGQDSALLANTQKADFRTLVSANRFTPC